MRIPVENRWIGADDPVFVAAEIGANFDRVETALKMIEAASVAGCDSVKIQTFRAETLSTKDAYFTFEDGSRVSQWEFWKAHEISVEAHHILKRATEDRGMVFFSTPSHRTDVEMLEAMNVPLYKLGSDDLTNYPFLEFIARKGKPMVISTGMCDLGEIEQAVKTILSTGNNQLVLLHCLTGYPAPRKDANMNVIRTLQNAFGLPVGFSDHTRGNLASILAVSMGAVFVEKHFTLDRSLGGPDNDVAVEPAEMASLVDDLKAVKTVLGSGVKRIQPGEEKWREAGRKSLVAARRIDKGDRITAEMIEIRRPSSGLHARFLDVVVGRRAAVTIDEGAMLAWDRLTD